MEQRKHDFTMSLIEGELKELYAASEASAKKLASVMEQITIQRGKTGKVRWNLDDSRVALVDYAACSSAPLYRPGSYHIPYVTMMQMGL